MLKILLLGRHQKELEERIRMLPGVDLEVTDLVEKWDKDVKDIDPGTKVLLIDSYSELLYADLVLECQDVLDRMPPVLAVPVPKVAQWKTERSRYGRRK